MFKRFPIDPATPKHLALLVTWARKVRKYYDHLFFIDKISVGKWTDMNDLTRCPI